MKPWRRIVASKDGYTTLPKECEEFWLCVPADYTVAIWSRGLIDTLLLGAEPVPEEGGLRVVYGISRGAFWLVSTVVGSPFGTVDKQKSSFAAPYPSLYDNILRINTIGSDGVPTGDELRACGGKLWRGFTLTQALT